jgi:hypothetical protein
VDASGLTRNKEDSIPWHVYLAHIKQEERVEGHMAGPLDTSALESKVRTGEYRKVSEYGKLLHVEYRYDLLNK